MFDFNKSGAEDEIIASEGENGDDKNDGSEDELEEGADEDGDDDEFDEDDDGTGPTIKVRLIYICYCKRVMLSRRDLVLAGLRDCDIEVTGIQHMSALLLHARADTYLSTQSSHMFAASTQYVRNNW